MAFAARLSLGALCFFAACSTAARSPRSGTSLAVFETYVRAWNARDTTALDTLIASDGIHEDLARGFRGVGAGEVKAFLREILKAEPDFQWHITSSFVDGPRVAAEWTWTSTYTGPSPIGPVTNRRISGRGASIAEVENGKIKRFTDYYDVASYFPQPTADSTPK